MNTQNRSDNKKKRFSEVYDIHGNGVARLNLKKAVKCRRFVVGCADLSRGIRKFIAIGDNT